MMKEFEAIHVLLTIVLGGEMETCSGIETKESVALAVRVAIMKSAHGNCSIRSTSHEMELPIQKR